MASLASLSAEQIIGLTADKDVNDNSHLLHLKKESKENEMEEELNADTTIHHDAKDTSPQIIVAADNDDDTPFCVSGSMKMHSYFVGGAGMDGGGGGMIMYMDGT